MTYGKKLSKKTVGNVIRAQLFENRLALIVRSLKVRIVTQLTKAPNSAQR